MLEISVTVVKRTWNCEPHVMPQTSLDFVFILQVVQT